MSFYNNPYGNQFRHLKSEMRHPIAGLLVILGIIVLGFWLVKGFLSLLWWAFPVVVIATLFLDYQVVVDYIKSIGESFQRNLPVGLMKAGITVFAAPVVAFWLLLKVLAKRRMQGLTNNFQNRFEEGLDLYSKPKRGNAEFAEFEEIESNLRQKS